MNRNTRFLMGTLVALLVVAWAATAAAEEGGFGSRAEVSLMGGIQALNENDTSIPDHFLNVPAVATLTYRLNHNLAVEGEFTWLIPVKQQIEVGTGANADLKTPDVLVYQANLRADWPGERLTPYLVGGVGAATFLSNTDADRVPQLDESQTVFAANLGGGVSYWLTGRWGVRADLREIVAFPTDSTAGLSNSTGSDDVWMERGTVGLSYRF